MLRNDDRQISSSGLINGLKIEVDASAFQSQCKVLSLINVRHVSQPASTDQQRKDHACTLHTQCPSDS